MSATLEFQPYKWFTDMFKGTDDTMSPGMDGVHARGFGIAEPASSCWK